MASFKAPRKPYSRPLPRAPKADVNAQWQHDMAPTGPRATRRNGPAQQPPNTRLVVTNLHYEISSKDLTAIFGQIGTLVCEPQIRRNEKKMTPGLALPSFKYDRSGRSSGTAIVSFETPAEATRAKKQFDGILAKTQPMSIAFDTAPPREPRVRSASAPTTSSLLNRIHKGPLLDRLGLSKDDSAVGRPPSGPRAGVGPIRTRQSRGRGAAAAPRPGPKKPKTAEELDKELDAFMVDAPPAPVAVQQDVDAEMI